jgi:hypothetical protein
MGRRTYVAVGVLAALALAVWPVPSQAAADPVPNAAGIQAFNGSARTVDHPTTNGKPRVCTAPCVSGWRITDFVASVRAAVTPPGDDPVALRAEALSVSASENYCENVATGNPGAFVCDPGRVARAFVRSVTIGVEPDDLDPAPAPLVEAHGIAASCRWNGGFQGSTSLAGLFIDGSGSSLPDSIPPNFTVPLGGGTLVINEQHFVHGGIGPFSVNALHLYMPTFEVIVGHAACGP